MSVGEQTIPVKLDYQIEGCSSFSASYHPSHITINKPTDQSSRWSSGSNNQLQYILLKLDRLSIVQTITFGKYHKVHVCNLKEFKVFGGIDPNHMTELLHSGLRNDSEPETFALHFNANGKSVPCLYIKIVPLLAWGANFNFSIWYVEMRGISDSCVVQKAYQDFVTYRESESIRLCLKHLRQRNYLDLFQMVQTQTNLQLEHPLLTELHHHLVINGDFDKAEELMFEGLQKGLYQEFIGSLPYKPVWKRINSPPMKPIPTMRGGHQMCIDADNSKIYLFGGWDGTKDLADMWEFDINAHEWTCITMDARKQGGPDPRSCHKICIDTSRKTIYTLGKYVDPDSRPNIQLDSDFWKFDIAYQRWTKISNHTADEGGPELIYDHQMLVDEDKGVIYVFGGRTISSDPSQLIYSGLYSYHIEENKWTLIRSDIASNASSIQMKSRIGHSMLFNPETREIYIFAGQRHKDFLADFYIYQIDTDTIVEVSRDYSKLGGPDAGFTQRATIDVGLGEFYMLSGLMREKNTLSETKNAFWVYSIARKKWCKVYENDNSGADYWAQMEDKEPKPRFAHQLVYDPNRRCQYLFGGNPGESGQPNLRLNDFWELYLTRPTPKDILRKAQFHIRKQRFVELCQGDDKGAALQYLQTGVSKVVNHEDPSESQTFRELTMYLFAWKKPTGAAAENLSIGGMAVDQSTQSGMTYTNPDTFASRTTLYENLLSYFPDSMREPKANLVDLVPIA